MIAAILRAQFLSMMRVSRGAVLGIVVMIFWYCIWTVAGVGAAIAFAYLRGDKLAQAVPIALFGVCAYWQLMPIISASLGASLDMRKLLAYPAPRGKLFAVEVLLRLTTAIEMLLVVTGITVGLSLNSERGGAAALPRLLLTLAIFILFNLLLASGTRSVLERFLARRRVREILALVMAMFWMIPRLLLSTGAPGLRGRGLQAPGAALQLAIFPWTSAAHASLGVAPWTSLALLSGWVLAALWFGRTQFERSLRFDALAAQATPAAPSGLRGEPWIERFYRWPGVLWRDPLAAIVEKELRSLARTPRFRMVFIMGFSFGLLVWFPVFAGRRGQPLDSPYFLVVVCMYSLMLLGQASFWNCFGFDRSATAFYFAVPQSFARILLAKNVTAMIFIYLETVILTGVSMALGLAHGWVTLIETLAVIGIASLYMLAAGNLNSVKRPRAANPDGVMHGAGSGANGGMMFVLYLLALVPIALAYLARYALDSEIAFVLVLAAGAAGGGVMYRSAMDSAVAYALARREQIIAELSKGQGPVLAE